MKVFLILLSVGMMLGCIAIVCALVLKYIRIRKGLPLYTDEPNKATATTYNKKIKMSIVIGALLLIGIIFFLVCVPSQMYTVNAGQVAVVRRFGAVYRVDTPGLRFKNAFSDTYIIFDLTVQQIQVDKWTYVDDLSTTQVMQVIANVQFQVNPDSVANIITTYGSLNGLKSRLLSIINGQIETSATNMQLNNLLTGNGKKLYQESVSVGLKRYETQFGIVITNVVIEEFVLEEALEEAKLQVRIAEENRKKREQELAKELAENANANAISIARAEADIEVARSNASKAKIEAEGIAEAAIARAEGDAKKQKLLADALAYEIEMIATAEAEAIRVKVEELEGVDSESLMYMQYLAWVEAWDGILPETMLGDGINLFFPTT
ncbi:MAG: hypothetical protein LBU04_04835 [Christensenellaceae bacterium]|jgi:regulator of protease activity HflC (stomatin/prohibitin superfamily)|nr:hypothetical protein [Christensenellaceae bacterium]